MPTYKVIITDRVVAIVEAVDEQDALKYAREVNCSVTSNIEVTEVKK